MAELGLQDTRRRRGRLWLVLLVVLAAAAGVRAWRLSQQWDRPLMPDMQLYARLAGEVSPVHPFVPSREPAVVWLTRAGRGLGAALGITPEQGQRLATALASLVTVLLLLGLARPFLGDAGALAAGLFLAASPLVSVYDVAGGRDPYYLLFLVAFAAFAFAPRLGGAVRLAGMGLMGGLVCLVRLSALGVVVLGAAAALAWRPGRGWWWRWLVVMLLVSVLVGPYLWFCWQATGDPLYAVNHHAAWIARHCDPALGAPEGFWSLLRRRWGLGELAWRGLQGMFTALWGPLAWDSFFARRSLPWHLWLAPFLLYLWGWLVVLWGRRWMPPVMIALTTGPAWPLLGLGIDPRLLLGALPFMALILGRGAAALAGGAWPEEGRQRTRDVI